MSSTTPRPIALILGSGPNIGTSLLSTLTSHNYLIATASRSSSTSPSSTTLSLTADFSNPTSIPPLFTAVKEKYGRAPSVVIYNAAALTPPPVDGNVLSVDGEAFGKDLNVNTVSAYVAGMEAVKAWDSEAEGTGEGEEKTFIYTGNALNQNVMPVPAFLTLGVGKSASAYWVGLADQVYRGQGYRFFYADQRQEDGAPMGTAVDGPAHAEFYAKLARREAGEVPWLATFVKGKGYVEF
ncbi:hypothetical protein ACET3X_005573 [Alternaria dauci]|uniref:Short-chain dehydrogenase n=1 Tax=Alternaria dauci TaxID=48095 RepID=A0ABR3UKN7_9PLEO